MTIFKRLPIGQGGFGLVELLVAVGIMVLVTTIVLANHGSFTAHSLLRTQSYDMALRIREAQQTAVSVSTQNGQFDRVYGVRWLHSAYNRYAIFSLPPFTASFTPSDAAAVGPPGLFDERFEIMCVGIDPVDSDDCLGAGEGVHIVFRRPNFDARFFDEDGNEIAGAQSVVFTLGPRGTSVYSASAGALREDENERTITVTRTGQISVNDPMP